MKTYRQHNCQSKHRTNHTFLNCALHNINWIHGNGNYAVIAWCNRTITLWHERPLAQQALDIINADACGHRCRHNHELITIDRGTK
ncbi:hypothetical protein [Leifsonia sp. Leaf336]|uniref:hypothetical protein n=1 Tax=Leifsonia sp. Leaf336 TaxID=1736341 RepID=UPI000ABFE257|nr:hypothetical protein [Leifsonia sp. Leaf336]